MNVHIINIFDGFIVVVATAAITAILALRRRLKQKTIAYDDLKATREKMEAKLEGDLSDCERANKTLTAELEIWKRAASGFKARLPETILAEASSRSSCGEEALAIDAVMRWIDGEGDGISQLLALLARWWHQHAAGEFRAEDLVTAEAYAVAAVAFWPQNQPANDLRDDIGSYAGEDDPPSRPLNRILSDHTEKRAWELFNADEGITATEEEEEASRRFVRGHYRLALSPAELAVQLYSKHFGRNDPRTLRAQYLMARILNRRGLYWKALEAAENVVKALETKSAPSPSNPDTLSCRFLVAEIRANLGQFDKALEDAIVAQAQSDKIGTADPKTLASRLLVANIRANLGQFDKALEDAIAVAQAQSDNGELGPSHPDTLCSRFVIAEMRTRLSQLNEALQEAIAVAQAQSDNENIGPSHPDTFLSRCLVAEIRANLGQFDKALEDAIAVAQAQSDNKNIGPSHPNTLLSRFLVAQVRACLGQLNEALQEAIAVAQAQSDNENIGASHPNTLLSRYLVVNIRVQLGQFDRALEKEASAVAQAQSNKIGPSHPSTLLSKKLVAVIRKQLGSCPSN